MPEVLLHEGKAVRTRPTWVRYRVLAAACILALIAYIHRVGFAHGGTHLKSEVGLSDAEWGMVMASFLVSYALFEIPWGVLGDWLGVRHLLALMVLGWSALTAAVALVPLVPATEWLGLSLPLATLLFLRFAFGAFQAGAFPTFSRVMADWMPAKERGTAQGTIWMCSRIGGAAAPFLMLALIKASGGRWELSFVVVALAGVVWCAFFWPWFRNRPEDMPQVNAAERELIRRGSELPSLEPTLGSDSEAVAAGLPASQLSTHIRDRTPAAGTAAGPIQAAREPSAHHNVPWARLLRCRSVWFLCFTYGFGGLSGNFFITLLPHYLVGHRGIAHEDMQWLTGLPLACGIIACFAGGLISDRFIRATGNRKWGRRLTGMIGTAAAGLCLLAVNWVDDVWLLGVLLCVTFFGNDLGMGPAWASCADIGERFAGTIGGAMNTFANLGGAFSAVIAGFLFGRVIAVGGQTFLGNEVVFWIFGCSYWLACLSWLGVDVTRPVRVDEIT